MTTEPKGYEFESLTFGEANAGRLLSFIQEGMWDPLKARSRMLRLLTEAAADPAKAAQLAFVQARRSRDGSPVGLFVLERVEERDHPALLLKNVFRRGSKPERALDKTLRLRSWFMAYTLAEHRGLGLATWAARLAETIDLEFDPPRPGAIPLMRAVDGALGALERGLRNSYPCRHLPGGVNFPAEAHHLAFRFIDEACDGPVFGRPDLSTYTLSAMPRGLRKTAKAWLA